MKGNKKQKHGRSRKPTVSTCDRPSAGRIGYYFSPLVVDSVDRNISIINDAPMELSSIDRVEISTSTEPRGTAFDRIHTTDLQATPPPTHPAPFGSHATEPSQQHKRHRKQPHPSQWVPLQRRQRTTRHPPPGTPPANSTATRQPAHRRTRPLRPPPSPTHQDNPAQHDDRVTVPGHDHHLTPPPPRPPAPHRTTSHAGPLPIQTGTRTPPLPGHLPTGRP